MDKTMYATFSFSAKIFALVYQFGSIEFKDNGIVAHWFGSEIYQCKYADILCAETTGRFPFWLKIVNNREPLLISIFSLKKLCSELENRGVIIRKVKKLVD